MRAWPTCNGPVGLALTNSTWMRSPVAGAWPNRAPSAAIVRTVSSSQSSVVHTLMNPGPATSTFSTNGAGARRADERLGHLARRRAGALGQGQRHVRREVAVVLLPRLLELRLGQVAVEPEPRRCGSQPVAEPRAQLVFDHPGPPSSSERTVATRSTVSNGFWT